MNFMISVSLRIWIFQTSADGMALIKEKMRGSNSTFTADRLVTIIDPYIDPNSQQFAKNNAKVYNLLHDISISAEATILNLRLV